MKIKKITSIVLSFVLFGSLMISCTKSKSIKPLGKLQLHFNLLNNSLLLGSNSNVPTTKSNLIWNEGFMHVTSVRMDSLLGEIEGKKSNEIEQHLQEKDSSSIINFFIPHQKFLNVNIAPGVYSNVKIRVAIAQTLTVPSLFLKGTFTNAKGNLIPVEFSLNEGNLNTNFNNQQSGEFLGGDDNELVLIAFAKKLNVDTQNIATATVNLDFKLLFEGVKASDFESATLINGCIIINKTTNSAIYKILKANIKKFSKID